MWVLLKQVCLAGWFLDSPSHLSTQTSSSYQLCDLLVYSGEPNVVLSSDRSSLGCYLWSARPSVFFYFFFTIFSLCVPSSSWDSGLSIFGVICPSLRLSDWLPYVFYLCSRLLAIHSKTIRFLFCLCQFTFCSCAWSSLFGIIISAQGVATCHPLNSASLRHRLNSSVTLWKKSSSTVAVKWTPNPYKSRLIPSSISLPPSGAI